MPKKSTPPFTAKKLAKEIWKILTPLKKKLIFLSLFVILINVGFSILPLFRKFLIDGIFDEKPFVSLIWIVIIWITFRIFFDFLNTIQWIWRDRLWAKIEKAIQNHTTKKVLNFSVGQFTNENTGIRVTKINRGIDNLMFVLGRILMDAGPILTSLIANSLFLFILGWQFGLFGIAIIIFNLTFIKFTLKWLVPRQKKIEKFWRHLGSFKWELFRNVDIVKQNTQEKTETQKVVQKTHTVWSHILRTWNRFAVMDFGRHSFNSIILGSMTAIGIWMITQDMTTAGSLVAAISWTAQIGSQMRNLSGFQYSLVREFESVRSFLEMLETPPAITFPDSAPKPDFQGNIKFKNISFSYEDNKPALKNVTFEIKSGQRVAFVGESGSGKTTITRLLQRFYDPTSGQILIDDHDLKTLHLPTFLQQTGVVSQDVKLFDTTLKKNILYSLPKGTKVSQARLKEVIDQSRINKFWHRLSKGFDTLLGENGVKLSGGEKQRVSIARALIKNPKLLIFDEATSSLDVESESEIQKAIHTVSKGRTTIIVAHRLSTIISADHIFVMSKGKLAGEGNHQQLMKKNKIYANLMKIQVRDLLSASFPDLDNKGMDKILKDLKII